MTSFIRACAAVSGGIAFAVLCVAVFGEIKRPKAVGVVFVLSLSTSVFVFAHYLKFQLVNQLQRLIGALGALFFLFFFLSMLYQNPFRVGWYMATDPWRDGALWISGLIVSNLFPIVSFHHEKIVAPFVSWLRHGEREKT